jgi:EAL domain-containing protein (putative c-di-GMP-specific phosphodiesterase class I)
LGCNTSLRDFDGVRDSSKVLEHLTPGMIKISEQAVELAQSDDKGRHSLKLLLNEASQAEAATIVPNVCNAATLATLWQLGAAFIQGSYLQDPAPAMDYEFAEIA